MSLPVRSALAAALAAVVIGLGVPARAGRGARAIDAQAQGDDGASLVASLDRIASAEYASDRPGAAVLVVKDGHDVLRRGYGLASVELGVPIAPDDVFDVGSITKQFTAAAILLLAQDGKLALTDDFRKFVPGYPSPPRPITIAHLLTHTAGLTNYTDSAKWRAQSRLDVTPPQLIDLWRGDPFAFPAGTDWRYSNSGYVLLGAIVEAVSGQPYGDFLRARVFTPLGMHATAYVPDGRVVPHRVAGYQRLDGRVVDAAPISLTQAYSAGGLLSTVDDLATWNASLDGASLLSEASKKTMFTAAKLENGRDTGYGCGWTIGANAGRPVDQHDGAINGFQSQVVRLPVDRVFVAVLSNDGSTMTDARRVAERLAAAAAGRPLADPPVVQPSPLTGDLAGRYEAPDRPVIVVAFHDGGYDVVQGDVATPLVPMGADAFFVRGDFARYTFVRDAAGAPRRVRLQTFARTIVADRRVAISLPAATLDRYAGTYHVGTMDLVVRRDGARLFASWNGVEVELHASAEDQFFVNESDTRIVFRKSAAGAIAGLVLRQNGIDTPGLKTQ